MAWSCFFCWVLHVTAKAYGDLNVLKGSDEVVNEKRKMEGGGGGVENKFGAKMRQFFFLNQHAQKYFTDGVGDFACRN